MNEYAESWHCSSSSIDSTPYQNQFIELSNVYQSFAPPEMLSALHRSSETVAPNTFDRPYDQMTTPQQLWYRFEFSSPLERVVSFSLVCNDYSSSHHYGVRTCEGCKGFFKVRRMFDLLPSPSPSPSSERCRKTRSTSVSRRNNVRSIDVVEIVVSGVDSRSVWPWEWSKRSFERTS